MDSAQRVVVTGAAGFIGQALWRALLDAAAANPAARTEHVATDRERAAAAVPHDGDTAARALRHPDDADPGAWRWGDIAEPALIDSLFARPVHRLFHLAGIVSGRAEADFALGKRVNLDATLALLERCRLQAQSGGPTVRFIQASSIAVFGTPLPSRIAGTDAALLIGDPTFQLKAQAAQMVETVGVSPKFFCSITRFRHAARLLQRASASLAGVAFESGYSDQSHMSHEFKRLADSSPAAYARGDVAFLQDVSLPSF